MNINDVETQEIQGDRLVAMFNRQKELVAKYKDLEGMPDYPMNVHAKESQKWFKDMAWRITEELGEASLCISECEDEAEIDHAHFYEELADGFHFLLELCIIVGIEPEEIIREELVPGVLIPNGDMLDYLFGVSEVTFQDMLDDNDQSPNLYETAWIITESLAKAMNCLKNKPWKQTQVLTDEPRFRTAIREAFYAYILHVYTAELTAEELTDLYFRKSEVNKFRQRSKY